MCIRDSYPVHGPNLVDKKELYRKTQELLDRFNVDIRPTDLVSSLTSGKRQIVEIIKAVSKNPKVLILDEPTSSLEEKEIQTLFQFIRTLKANRFSIIYISHHTVSYTHLDVYKRQLHGKLCRKILQEPMGDSLYAYMRNVLHIYPTRAVQSIEVGSLTDWEASLLGTPDLKVSLLTHRQTFNEVNEPVEYAISKYRSDRYKYFVELNCN